MTAAEALSELRQYQIRLLEIIKTSSAEDIVKQFHSDLSPLSWHLGHCVFTENYWLREVVLGREKISDEHKQLYIPELSVKSKRSAALPSHTELCEWAAKTQQQNIVCFNALIESTSDAALMQENYLIFFLSQHYAQHIETANYILAQRNLQLQSNFKVENPLNARAIKREFTAVNQGCYVIGAENRLRHYDNECAKQSIELPRFKIATRAVSNAEFLGFIEGGAYENAEHWGEVAWQWKQAHSITHPQHWRCDDAGYFYGTNANGHYLLEPHSPVCGLSHHEASALAHWAGARLPHEYEWEVAKKAGLLSLKDEVWEWCLNTLHPYEGFEAFPYAGYSLPWFDEKHFTLRGHSQYTLPAIKRDTFRNFYQADKRHFPAGLRLVVI